MEPIAQLVMDLKIASKRILSEFTTPANSLSFNVRFFTDARYSWQFFTTEPFSLHHLAIHYPHVAGSEVIADTREHQFTNPPSVMTVLLKQN